VYTLECYREFIRQHGEMRDMSLKEFLTCSLHEAYKVGTACIPTFRQHLPEVPPAWPAARVCSSPTCQCYTYLPVLHCALHMVFAYQVWAC
jgi:hypothetical protein